MRYNSEHKAKSRERIVEAARQLFRKRGFDGASIDQVMHRAGLTRGAFYAHFESKEQLISEVLGIEAGLVLQLRAAADAPDPAAASLRALSEYLEPEQRSDVATGCPLVAHPVDSIRGDQDRRQRYTDRLRSLTDSLQDVLDDERDDAVLVSVLAVGGALLSSASSDPQFADAIGRVCLDQIKATLSQ
jgi:AcrR family transcriptional regulator